ncbi:phenylacetate--CoA ligase family protein [Candidatus Formimonas warabiya]|uniref:Phenylacetate-coenzyme A ligase n=1 Tax=Formimonas warabiya TaxID=1761012 RepID=A0A3G1KSY2_FORW1|nr:phenylacetate--CoA ligase [Candidatus Formimonas warabiya]ATW25536.1 phenylacetate--CoA ligase [Candidatus Formimonas warabiya]
MYWNEKCECMPREELEQLQLERLKQMVERCYHNVLHYRKAMQELGVEPEDIQSLEDLRKLPFTVKTDLRDNYPYGLFAVPLSEIVRIHSSSGTTGKPIVVGYTRQDLNNWAELIARSLGCAEVTKQDVIQISYGYGLFTGGLGIHNGAEKVGASVIPTSGGNNKRQVMIMRDFGSTALACTPSYALVLAEEMEELGISKDEIKLRVGIFGAEPWSQGIRKEIESRLGISAHDIYGLSEVMGPGVSMECGAKNGLHVWEDHFIPEIINPETGAPLPYGEMGELVFTTITKEGFPVIRYRTRDLSCLHVEKCACGRTHVRMDRITGRSDDMLIIRGVNVFPSQIESVLLEIGNTTPNYHLIVDRINNLDTLEVQVEVSDQMFSDEIKRLEELEHVIRKEIESVLGISCKVTLVEPKTLARSEGKAKRVTDKRVI